MAVCRKWEVLATVIGEVTDGDRLEITWHGETVVDVPPRTVAHEGPVYERPVQRPDTQDALNADTSAKLPRPSTGDELRATLLAMLGSPHLCSRAFITEQYDRYVRGNTVLAETRRRRRAARRRGHRPRHRDVHRRVRPLHPARPVRRRAARAGRGVPQRRRHRRHAGRGDQLPQLRLARGPGGDVAVLQAVRGLADGCAALGIPVTGGNVSFYNQTGTTPILPTPVVGVLGVIDDVKPAHPDRAGHRTGRDADPARRHPRRVRRLDLGAGHRRPSRRAAAARSISSARSCSPRC